MKTTTGGNEALSVWEEHGRPIDLLLTDMIMPDGMTGRDLAKQLLTRNPRLKVIYTSGYTADSEGMPSELRQAPAFLQKRYHPQKLARAVRECLDLAAVKSMNETTDEHRAASRKPKKQEPTNSFVPGFDLSLQAALGP